MSSSAPEQIAFKLGPDINSLPPSSSGNGYNHQAKGHRLRKRDRVRQSLWHHRPWARPHSQLQTDQTHGVSMVNNISSAAAPPGFSNQDAISKAEMAHATHPDLYNQCCSRSLEPSDFQSGVEASTPGDPETGSTLYETSQTGFSSASSSSSSSNEAVGLQVYPGKAGNPLSFTGAAPAGKNSHKAKKPFKFNYGDKACADMAARFNSHANVEFNGANNNNHSNNNTTTTTTTSNEAAGLQVYPGKAGKPLSFKGAAPASKDSHKVKKPFKFNYGDKACADMAARFNSHANVGRTHDGESRRISKYIPSPDPSVPTSSNPGSNIYPSDNMEMLSSPSNYSDSRSISTDSEFSLPPPASLTNTLGRSSLGIDVGTKRYPATNWLADGTFL